MLEKLLTKSNRKKPLTLDLYNNLIDNSIWKQYSQVQFII